MADADAGGRSPSRMAAMLRFAVAEFGPLIAFWVLAWTSGTKVAIAGSVIFILVDAAWRLRTGKPFTRIYLLSSALTVTFGVVDLYAEHPFMLKYEAVVTNMATGIAFVLGARGPKPMIQEVAEQRQGKAFSGGADILRFFQIFTLIWALYFFLKAGFYLWVAWTMPLMHALALRSVVGGVSLGVMIALSVTQGRRLFFLCRRFGLLPPAGAGQPG